jgi:hypothetical protein
MVPLRDLLDVIDGRLDRIERKLDAIPNHSDKVGWGAFVTVLVSLTGLLVLIAVNI